MASRTTKAPGSRPSPTVSALVELAEDWLAAKTLGSSSFEGHSDAARRSDLARIGRAVCAALGRPADGSRAYDLVRDLGPVGPRSSPAVSVVVELAEDWLAAKTLGSSSSEGHSDAARHSDLARIGRAVCVALGRPSDASRNALVPTARSDLTRKRSKSFLKSLRTFSAASTVCGLSLPVWNTSCPKRTGWRSCSSTR
jgi:hypothetical protein